MSGRGVPGWAGAAAAGAAALLASAALAQPQAQDEGPIVVGAARPHFKGVELVRLDAALELTGQWRRDELRQDGQPTLKESESLYKQTLDLAGEAYIGHKNLIDLSGDIQFGLEEDSLHSDATGSGTSYTAVTDLYDLRALVLGNAEIPTTVYARRDESYVHQNFGGSIKSTTNEFGAIAQFRSQIIPTQLQVFHREQDQTDQLGRGGFSYTQDSAILHSDVRLTQSQRMLLDYTYDHINESGTGGFHDAYDHHNAIITHWLNFGPQSVDSLRSSLRLEDRTGTFSERIAHLDEELVFEHSKRLETRYNLSLEDLNREDQEQRLARASALIRHRLFDSLTSTGTVGASTLDVPGDFTSNELFADGALDYTKLVPLGRLNASASLGGTRQENGARGSTVSVLNGTYVFNDPFPLTINRRNIVPASIVVRDTAGIRVFVQGADYTVDAFPDRVELRRVLGGAISNGQAVIIDFDVGPEPANTIDSTTLSFSARYDINEGVLAGLGIYGTYRQLDQGIDTADPSRFVLDSYKEWRYGAEYRIGGARFLAERVNHDSNITPYDSTRLEAQYDHRFGRSSVLTVGLSREAVEYRLTGDNLELYLLTGRWTDRLAENLDWSVHMEGRLENHSDSPDIRGIEGGVDLSWHKNQTSVYASIFGSFLDAGPSTTISETFSVGIKRAF